jgi:hypothetical protein
MKVKFELTPDDYLIFSRRFLKRHAILHKKYVFIIAIVLAFLIRGYYGPSKIETTIDGIKSIHDATFWFDILFNIIFLGLIILFFRFINILKVKKQIRDNPELIGLREVDFTPDIVRIKTSIYTIEYDVVAFKSIEEIKDYYYLYISKASVLIIPKRALTNSDFLVIFKNLNNNGSL